MTEQESHKTLLDRIVVAVALAFHRAPEGPIGMCLSGGIDSSSIYTITRRLNNDLPCFTGYYEGESFDERPYARMVAGENHHEVLITPNDFVDHFEDMVAASQPPFQGPGAFGQYMVARYASEHVRTLLSGEGGDELFGGYARLMIVAGGPAPDGYDNYQLPSGYPSTVKEALAWDYERLPNLLAVDEQMTAAFGLDALAPFTDPVVSDWVLGLEPEQRLGKRLLRQAMRGLVPDAILDRTDKRGFPIPLVSWTGQEPVRSFVRDRLGYLPEPGQPWARAWWVELCERSYEALGVLTK